MPTNPPLITWRIRVLKHTSEFTATAPPRSRNCASGARHGGGIDRLGHRFENPKGPGNPARQAGRRYLIFTSLWRVTFLSHLQYFLNSIFP